MLASGSPRRRAFLEGSGLEVVVRPVDLDETPRPGEDPVGFARRMAAEKVAAAEGEWALASDTVVTLDGRILGKPADADDAARMLGELAGRTHAVVTAWALRGPDRTEVRESTTRVGFRELTEAEVAAYVTTGDPLDKAGAYGIQSGAGAFVSSLEGTYDTVVGLPFGDVLAALVERGFVAFPTDVARRAALIRGRIGGAGGGARLVGASKRQPVEKLRDAVACGVVDLGESYVQEWRDKAPLVEGVTWHFIGHLQRNKAKYLGPEVKLVHGVDSVRLAEALGKVAVRHGHLFRALVQVNAAGEATKGGVAPGQVGPLLEACDRVEGVEVVGLMTLPPDEGRVAARARFEALRRLRDELATPARPLPELSMGMSEDYELAVGEGATLVRVGTALFGPRPA